jgi:hypothetical protein
MHVCLAGGDQNNIRRPGNDYDPITLGNQAMPSHPQSQDILNHLFRTDVGHPSLQTFAILDAGRGNTIYQKIVDTDIPKMCLFHGSKAVELAQVAPYLVQLSQDDPFTHWLIQNGWGKSWGVFFQSSDDIDTLQRHFRKFLIVYTEDGKPLYFRFYDPRVLRVYLPTCNPGELRILYGPISRYVFEADDSHLLEFTCNRKYQLIEHKHDLGH